MIETEIKAMTQHIMLSGIGLIVANFTGIDRRFLLWAAPNDKTLEHLVTIMHELYEMKMYDKYDVKGKIVIDVGAYYGDTAIHFSKMGASKVICYEPYASGMLLPTNCVLNGVGNFEYHKEPIIGEHKALLINASLVNDGGTVLSPSTDEKLNKVQALTLEDIAIRDAIIKIDCENSEHEIFAKVSPETLRKFSALMVECHGRYDDVKAKLEASGMIVDEVKTEYLTSDVNSSVYVVYAHRLD